MVLVGAKADMQKERKVTKKQGELLSQKHNMKFIETSAKNNENIDNIFEELAWQIIQRCGEEGRLKDMIQNRHAHFGKKR